MKLTRVEGADIVYNDHDDWERIEGEVIDTSRWSIHYEGVFKHKPSGKHYSLCWSVGATETQDEGPFDYDDPEPVEVVKKEVTVTKWVPVE
jgi:hypothetical protein